jgi:methylated-DNA-[protein]-cysteine S-methyltransferase
LEISEERAMKQLQGTFTTPLGTLAATLDDAGRLHELAFVSQSVRVLPRELEQVRAELAEYFAGERERFDFELAPRGTEFQRAVWSALTEIPYGTTTTYAALARHLGRPNAVRAVGAANGANPWAIVVPCHRVIGADGSLTGYAGGLERKRALLELERASAHGEARRRVGRLKTSA